MKQLFEQIYYDSFVEEHLQALQKLSESFCKYKILAQFEFYLVSNDKKLNEENALRDYSLITEDMRRVNDFYLKLSKLYQRMINREQDWKVSGIVPQFTNIQNAEKIINNCSVLKIEVQKSINNLVDDLEILKKVTSKIKDVLDIKNQIEIIYSDLLNKYNEIRSRGEIKHFKEIQNET